MSTRCQIGIYSSKNVPIEKPEALIYRHSDGYPEGVLPEIEPFLRWWTDVRGISDVEYTGARLLQYLCNKYDMSEEGGFTGTLGYGICKDFHLDIEYYYRIYPSSIEVYEVEWNSKPKDWTLINTINLREEDK